MNPKRFSDKCSYLFILCLAITLIFVSCGGGGDDSPPAPTVTPPSQNATGTYTLTNFKVTYSNGLTITEKDVSSFSGTMKIGSNTISQQVTVNGVTVAFSGTYTITWQGSSVGIVHVTDQSGTHDVQFSISNYILGT